MDKILKGVLNYRQKLKPTMVQKLNQLKETPTPAKAVFFTCIDSRLQPSAFTSTEAGDMFIVRNAGNMVPHASKLKPASSQSNDEVGVVSTEAAALELGCSLLNIKHVIVCGHSDCKAIQLLHTMQTNLSNQGIIQHDGSNSPLRRWMEENGGEALLRYKELENGSFRDPMMIRISGDETQTPAFIDPCSSFDEADKLSQINTLVQLENVASYPFVSRLLQDGTVMAHAFWFDIHSGEVHYFSKLKQHFDVINEENASGYMEELASLQVLHTANTAMDDSKRCLH